MAGRYRNDQTLIVNFTLNQPVEGHYNLGPKQGAVYTITVGPPELLIGTMMLSLPQHLSIIPLDVARIP